MLVKLYRFHPITRADANDIQQSPEYAQAPDAVKQELAAMVRNGARFYWEREPDSDRFVRVERSNVAYVYRLAGIDFEFVED